MSKIELLDCTLRDGGHLTGSYFGRSVIQDIISKLIQSRIEIVEVGFLKDCIFNPDYALYNNVSEAMQILPPKAGGVKYALLVQEDQYNVNKLEPYDGTIDVIRVSFHDYDLEEGLEFARRVIEKGYQVYINPINLLGYTDGQILEIIAKVNKLKPYGFTIVDTFGSMLKDDLIRLVYLIDNNLDSKISLAIHLHENQSLSYSLAQIFIEEKPPTRDICVDGSLYGMGRIPGNLCIELIMEYMNRTHESGYDIEPVYDAIDDYIVDIKKKIPWGYSTAYALSAQHRVHRTFAEYLLDKGTLKTKQINQILSMIEPERKTRWDKNYIEKLYIEYQNKNIDDTETIQRLQSEISRKRVLLLAPGGSINSVTEQIKNLSEEDDVITISANFIWDKLEADYAFFSNFKRWGFYGQSVTRSKKIITSNLQGVGIQSDFIVNYADYAFTHNKLYDNCGIMLIKLVCALGVKEIILAGYDGVSEKNNFAVAHFEREISNNKWGGNQEIGRIIREIGEKVPLSFLTPSLYEKEV